MEHDEHVLNLSDVVHDNITDDQDIDSANSEHHTSQRTASTFDAALHDAFTSSEHNPQSLPSEFSVEMLEREIASLLNQNASAASAALLNAAAQQRSAHLGLSTDSSDNDTSNASLSGINLSLSGLAAVLQAAHAHASDTERVHDELTVKDMEYARQHDAAIAAKERQSTRSAPAFHSLTAGEDLESSPRKRRRREGRSGSEGSDYMFTDGEDLSEMEAFEPTNEHILRTNHPSSRPRSVTPSPASNSVPGEFADINDILTQLSAQFEPPPDHGQVLSASDPSPVVSRVNASDNNNQPEPTHNLPQQPPDLSPLNRATITQPTASTSALPIHIDPMVGSKSPKKGPLKEKGHNQHTCEHEHCQKSFTRRSDLARHMRIHTGERPFVCNYNGCGKTFIQRSALHVHSRVHTGEKPHCCEYPGCGKTFGDSSSLARHRRTHTGKRPYKCEDPSCEKTFTRRTTLTTHMRTHDPNWEPDPNVKYNFKGKKRKVSEEDDARELAEHVQTISALFQAGHTTDIAPNPDSMQDDPLEVRVASISAEIAAAIAQAHSRVYQEPDEEEHSGSGRELDGPETITPNTSGIRGLDAGDTRNIPKEGRLSIVEEDDDSDAFPVPLRSRKPKESPLSGHKRKR